MSELNVSVLKSGMYTTIQDSGRYGFRAYGVPVSGYLDRTSAKLANFLVGNDAGSPLLEITMKGPVLQFDSEATISITGAEMEVHINGSKLFLNQSVQVSAGSVLEFGKLLSGCRAYLAIGGKWKLKSVMGSCSTYVPAGIGGLNGGSLKQGDLLAIDTHKVGNRSAALNELRHMARMAKVRILPGPEFEYCSEISKEMLLTTAFKITSDSNRMGYRLEGARISLSINGIISSGVVPGTIQVTNEGQPIILLADAQTIGGYPRIANIMEEDLDVIAQLKPGDELRFLRL